MKKEHITNPKINQIVHHTGWGFEDNKNYPCDVLITGGNYEINGRISNFWHWKRILPDGSLSKEEYGYGSFVKTKEKYDISIKVNKIK